MDFISNISSMHMPSVGQYNSLHFLPNNQFIGQDMQRDYEYFNQMYPAEIKRYQRRIQEILETQDYQGSMIYDEYPDKFALQQLCKRILDIICREEEITDSVQVKLVEQMIFLLLCNALYQKRMEKRMRPIYFFYD